MRNTWLVCTALAASLAVSSVHAQNLKWEAINPTLNASGLERIEVIDGRFVVYGKHGRFLTSANGLTWTATNLPSNSQIRSLAYGDGLWVALGKRGEVYRRAGSGPWTLNSPVDSAPASGSTVISDLAFGNGVFVRTGEWTSGFDDGRSVSTDGLDWSATGLPPEVTALHFTGSRFLAARHDYRGVELYTSVDGRDWTRILQTDDLGSHSDDFVQRGDTLLLPGDDGFITSVDGGETWSLDTSRSLKRVTALDNVFYAEDEANGAYLTSDDGSTWTTLAEAVPDRSLLGAARMGATTVTLTDGDRPMLAVSTDGLNWIDLHDTILPLDRPAGLVAGNGLFNAAGGYLSIDGLQWFDDGFWPEDRGNTIELQFCHDRFFYLERRTTSAELPSSPLRVYTSIDGRVGELILTAETTADRFGHPAYLNGTFFLPWNGGVLTSTNGTHWENQSDQTAPPALAGNGEVLARVGTTTTIYGKEEPLIEVSTDGASWQRGYTFQPDSDPSGRRLAHRVINVISGGDRMVAAVTTSDWHSNRWSSVVQSPDGLHWFETNQDLKGNHALGFNDGWFTCVTRDGDTFVRFVTVIYEGNRFNYSRDGAEWQTVPMHEAEPDYVVSNGNVFLAASASGEIWRAALGPRTPPVITESNLHSAILHRAERAMLSVTVTGSGPFTYQWRRNGHPLVGENAPSLLVPADPDRASGRYDVLVSNELGTTQSTTAEITLRDSWLSNLSSLAFAGTDDAQAVQGFVLKKDAAAGSARYWVPILLRAVGPTLADFGVNQPLPDPRFSLLSLTPDARPQSNDDWFTGNPWLGGSQFYLSQIFAEAGAFALPEDSKDAALDTSLLEGRYTFNVSEATGRTGPVLTELYDYRGASSPVRLVNLSTRALTGPGDRTLIMGFVVVGTEPLRVLLRGVGPGLQPYIGATPLPNPRITLHDATGREIHNNDTWSQARNADELPAAMAAVGAFALPADSNDAAMLEWLEPGLYKLMVHSQDDSEGIALGEIYAMPR